MFKINEVRLSNDEDFEMFRTLATSTDEWIIKYNKNDIKVYTKWTDDSRIKLIKVSAMFEGVSLDCLYDVIHDPDYRKVWDKDMYDSYDVCKLNSNNVIGWYAAKLPPPLMFRDWCLLRTWRKTNQEFSIFNHSVQHMKIPVRKMFVRSHSYVSGYYGEKITDTCTKITFVSQTDPKGKLPKWFVNTLATVMSPRIMKKLHKTSLAYTKWKSKNNPHSKPWLDKDINLPLLDFNDIILSTESEATANEIDEVDLEQQEKLSIDLDQQEKLSSESE
ncbi:START domain-containing protein 10 isoform X1 [Hydra vulgaris]|uniref:START domain-containing protein 10 n=1 Tax=Hydra vulgaris TaxID=6087 RepID=T2M340_HYDVU|nr:START domain-containing protein 10 [Hydra vulgaris]